MTLLYRALLRLYPRSFRQSYGEEMVAVFTARTAGRGALAKFGTLLAAVAEEVPGAGGAHWTLLKQDLRYAARTLRRSPAFTVTAILVTALGVGANTASFSAADFVLFRPLPYAEARELVRICEGPVDGSGSGCMNQLSPSNYRDLKAMNGTLESFGLYSRGETNLAGGAEPARVGTAGLTPDVMPMLGVRAALGRTFSAGSDSVADASTVVLGYGLWQERFGGDSSVVGRTVTMNGIPRTVIGVMPARFQFPDRGVQAWTLLDMPPAAFEDRNNSYVDGIGRLKQGVTFEAAHADLVAGAARLARDFPATNAETGVSFFGLHDAFSQRFRLILLALCGASLCVLLIACANLANLLLVRAAAREPELELRAALGAGKERLVRQMVTESMVLAVVGGALGILLAVAVLPFFARLVPPDLPAGGAPSLDLRLLALAVTFTALTGLGFGLIPAIRAGGKSGFTALRGGARAAGKGSKRMRTTLVATEVAMSVALLITSGLFVRAIGRVQAIDPGFDAGQVITLRTALPRPRYDDPATRVVFYQRVLDDVRLQPGVASAAYVSGLPMEMTGGVHPVRIPGEEFRLDNPNMTSVRFVTPQFFETLDIELKLGRDVEVTDTRDRPQVAVVSESFVKRHWPDQEPLGRTFVHRDIERTVIGVVSDIKVRGRERTSEPQMYLPAAQVAVGDLSNYDPKELVIRHTGNDEAIVGAVRRIVGAVDQDQPISHIRTLEQVVAGETATRRAQLYVLGALTGVALLLSVVGIHGLLAYAVSQRAREIGVRLALGAAPAGIAWMVVREAIVAAGIGVTAGVFMAYMAAKGMSALLFGVPPADMTTIGVAVGLALGAALIGSLAPARRALGVSPMLAMRGE
jgi:predicted permease